MKTAAVEGVTLLWKNSNACPKISLSLSLSVSNFRTSVLLKLSWSLNFNFNTTVTNFSLTQGKIEGGREKGGGGGLSVRRQWQIKLMWGSFCLSTRIFGRKRSCFLTGLHPRPVVWAGHGALQSAPCHPAVQLHFPVTELHCNGKHNVDHDQVAVSLNLKWSERSCVIGSHESASLHSLFILWIERVHVGKPKRLSLNFG